ncbi:MAG: hypothetical protein FWG87_12420 [Defluviitaleaceae bacterium]|nr:hypothetical protein [Defluviitaleaceae bacterium]
MNFPNAMNEVLDRRRYDVLMGRRRELGEAIADFLQGILDFLGELFSFDVPFSFNNASGIIAAIFIIAGIIMAVVAVYAFVRSRSWKKRRHSLSDIFEEMKHCTLDELLQLSESAADRRLAVRYKYIAVILSLNEKNRIFIEPHATNSIILKQLKRSAPELAPHFSQVAEAFHYAWFGHKALNDQAFAEFNSAVTALLSYKGERHAEK